MRQLQQTAKGQLASLLEPREHGSLRPLHGLLALLLAAMVPLDAGASALSQQLDAALSPYVLSAGEVFTHQVSEGDLAAFYAARDFEPAWTDADRRDRLERALAELILDGLDPEHYPLGDATAISDEHSLCDELAITRSYLQALLHLHFGMIERANIEPLWHRQEPDISPRRTALLQSAHRFVDDPGAGFTVARPELTAYQALREAYGKLLLQRHELPWPMVSPGPLLRQGTTDPRVGELRRRLRAGRYTFEDGDDENYYNEALEQAVRQFQHHHYLAEDGLVGPATLAELNKPRSARLDQLRVNLERLRWRAGEREPHMVVVDIAGARLRYYRDGELIQESRTQVGTSARRTPILKSAITHFTFNPSWTIPPTILRQDKLPRIRNNPDYLAESNLRVLDTEGNVLDPDQVDWDRPGAIMLRQDPGPDNPLGQVAIRFPNPFAVYLHDTPSQRLFASARRTFSSGCVRVESAMSLVDRLIATASDYSEEYISRVIASGRTGNIHLTTPVPLLMDYWTADVDDCGEVILRPDIYRRDNNLAEALRQAPLPRALPACPVP